MPLPVDALADPRSHDRLGFICQCHALARRSEGPEDFAFGARFLRQCGDERSRDEAQLALFFTPEVDAPFDELFALRGCEGVRETEHPGRPGPSWTRRGGVQVAARGRLCGESAEQ